MKGFQKQHPKIEFELLQGNYTEIERWVHEGKIDCGFLRLPALSALDSVPVLRDRYLVVMPEHHPLSEESILSVDRLKDDPFILLGIGEDNIINLVFEGEKVDLNVKYHVVDDYTIMSMVENGLGIGILPELVLNRTPYRIITKELSTRPYRTIGIVLRDKKTASTAVRHFLEYTSKVLVEEVKKGEFI